MASETMRKIQAQELYQTLNAYIVSEDLSYMTSPRGLRVNIDCQNMLLPLLYIITKTFGYSISYSIENLEDMSGEPECEIPTNGTPAGIILTVEEIKSMEDELRDHNIFLGTPSSVISNELQRMAIFTSADFASEHTLFSAFAEVYNALGISTRDCTTLNEISTAYVYVEDTQTYTANSAILAKLMQWNATSFVLVCSIPATTEERACIRIEQLIGYYDGIINAQNTKIMNSSSPELQEVLSLPIDKFRMAQAARLYQSLISIEQEYLIIDLLVVPQSLRVALALAFINAGKKPIFTCGVEDSYFCQCVIDVHLLTGFPVIERIERMMISFEVGQLMLLQNGRPYMSVLQGFNLNIRYKLVKLEDIAPFISKQETQPAENTPAWVTFTNLLPADECKEIPVYDETSVNIYDLTPDKSASRFRMTSFSELVKTLYGNLSLSQYEDVTFAYLRSLEQIIYNYTEIKTVGDIIVLSENAKPTYIGFASINPVCEADCVLAGSITRMIHLSDVPMNIAPINIVYDFRSFIKNLVLAIQNTHMQPYHTLNAPKIYPLTSWQTTKILYHYLGANTFAKRWYDDLELPGWQKSELAYLDNCIENLRNTWFPAAKEVITSYGMRLLNVSTAPITIYGSINFANTRGSGNRSKTIMYWESFKHLPKYRKGGHM